MSTPSTRTYAGVSQRHKPCGCGQAHTASCARRDDESAAARCRCPRAHGERCEHRTRADGKAACACPWAFVAEMMRAGKRVQATGSGFPSKTAAARARAEALETLQRAPKAAKRGKTLGDTMDDWLSARSEGSKALRPSTLHDYRRYVEYVRESIGETRLRDVDATTLDVYLRWLRKTHPGADTMHVRAFAILQAALRWAARRGLIAADPTLTYDARPEVASKRRESLQPPQFLRLHSWADANGERLAPLLWVAVMTGMRRGELAALSWLDVDLERGSLTVRANAVQIGREVVVGAPKTTAGDGRRVALDAQTVAVLRGIQAQQQLDAQAWGDDYQNGALLVFTHENGAALMPEVMTRGLPRLIRRYNRERDVHALPDDAPELAKLATHKGMGAERLARIRADETLDGAALPIVAWHSLRHLSASIHLAASQGDVFSVSRRLGHANVTTTATIYGHEIESVQHAQTEAAARALQGQLAPSS